MHAVAPRWRAEAQLIRKTFVYDPQANQAGAFYLWHNRAAAEAGCARREEAVWREKLVLAVQQSGRPLDAGQRSRLVALQMSWEGYVAQKCAFYAATQREALQPGRQAGCELREVAARVLELERNSRPQAPARRPSQQQPQIIR